MKKANLCGTKYGKQVEGDAGLKQTGPKHKTEELISLFMNVEKTKSRPL